MSLNSQWFQKYKPSNLKEQKVNPSKDRFTFCSFNFDGLHFWNHREFGDTMHLILKVYSVVNWSQQLKGMTALLPSSTPFSKRPFYRGKSGFSDLFFPPL